MSAATTHKSTSAHILETAAEHFALKGYEGARIDEIAASANINKAAIYYHVGNKLTLYQVLISEAVNAMLAHVKASVERASSPEAKIRAYVYAIADHMQGVHHHFPGMMMREILCGAEHLPDETLLKMHDVKNILAGIIEEGHRQQLFRDANPFSTHMLIIGTLMIYATGEPLRLRMNKLMDSQSKPTDQTCQIPMSHITEDITNMVLHSLSTYSTQDSQP